MALAKGAYSNHVGVSLKSAIVVSMLLFLLAASLEQGKEEKVHSGIWLKNSIEKTGGKSLSYLILRIRPSPSRLSPGFRWLRRRRATRESGEIGACANCAVLRRPRNWKSSVEAETGESSERREPVTCFSWLSSHFPDLDPAAAFTTDGWSARHANGGWRGRYTVQHTPLAGWLAL